MRGSSSASWRGHLFGLILTFASSIASGDAARPNVVLILADDMGYSDIGSFGGEIDTPHLNRVAEQGIRFSQFYNTARCSPTRAALLSGRYPHKVQMGHLAGKRFSEVDGYRGDIEHAVELLPELLRRYGYKNYMAGKWHVASLDPGDLQGSHLGSTANTPLARGFDAFYGTLLGGNNYFSPKYLYRNDSAATASSSSYYYTDAITSHAVKNIEQHHAELAASSPFFMYVSYTAPHWPIQAPEQTIKKYRERYRSGWQSVRNARYQRLIGSGIIDSYWQLTDPDVPLPNWNESGHLTWRVERMATHAAMIDHVDQGVGKLLAALEAAAALENTLILFLSDNGASAEEFPAAIPPAMLERLRPFTDKYAPASGAAMAIGNNPAVLPGPSTTLQSIGPHWAQVSNTPFRKFKSWVHEGGVATPLLAHWPSGMTALPGALDHVPGHVIDILPTVLDAAGIPLDAAQDSGNPIDGVSLLPSLRGAQRNRGPIYFEHEGHRAIRDGAWKLVAAVNGEWELYNMAQDRTETKDLADRYPERVSQMSARYERYAKSSKVRPWAELESATAR